MQVRRYRLKFKQLGIENWEFNKASSSKIISPQYKQSLLQPDDSSINQRHEKGIKIFDTLGIDCKKAKFKNHSRQLFLLIICEKSFQITCQIEL